MTDVKLGQPFYPGVDTEFDKLGDASEFGIEITNAATGALIEDGTDDNVVDGVFSEVMWTDPATSGTSAGSENVIGASILSVPTHGFSAGQRFDDGAGNLYSITATTTDTISIKGALVADIADATALASVGNTGIYKTTVTLAAPGEYFVSLSHPEFGHISSKYNVVENSLADTYERIDEGFNKLGASGKMLAIN